MKKIPISLIIDDPAPVISVYYEHARSRTTKDGRPLIPTFPNSMLLDFCNLIERYGIKGKFSVVPMPGNKGDIVNGLESVSREDLDVWLDTVKARVAPHFSIGPEILSHHKAVDLATGQPLEMREDEWSASQNRFTLTPYIAHALSLLREAGFSPVGVTSPWSFGIAVEGEYESAISRAVYEIGGSKYAWFFLRARRNVPNAVPWVVQTEEGRMLVSIPATTRDHIWQTIDSADTSEEYVRAVADCLITEDGTGGEILDVLNTGGYPILITHWQSLMSNGLGTGLRVLEEVGRRIRLHLSERVEWMSFEEIMHTVIADPTAFPKPAFED
ncbi:MAG: hypothetical protein IJW30_02005 [Clostridia bacterium]|nr:hypothetical protein [Clostridia bacterium]